MYYIWNDTQSLLFFGSAFLTVILITIVVAIKAMTSAYPKAIRYEEEKSFFNPNANKNEKFPSIEDAPTVSLSVIVPAYEEEQRLPKMLDECLKYLEEKSSKDSSFTYEVIIVSDGSKDGTVELAHSYSRKYSSDKIRVLALTKNRGKGGAVRLGMQSARGKCLLFADADGATTFSEYDKVEEEMKTMLGKPYDWQKCGIVIGSRAHLEVEAIATRSLFRTILMQGFHLLVWLFAVRRIRDTQCGFKLFTRTAARRLFNLMHVERWAFDVEVLFLAQTLNIPIVEICVAWMEIEGSKITPVWTWVQMGKDLFFIWFRYLIGAWRFDESERKAHFS